MRASACVAIRAAPPAHPNPSEDDGEVSRARVFRRSADRQSAPRQLSRRDQALRRDAEDASVHLLRRRSACDDDAARAGAACPHDARSDRGLSRLRHRSQSQYRLQPEPGRRTCRARLGTRLRRAARLAQPHDPVQGESGQGPRERLGRPLQLSGADGRRHSRLSRHPRSGRRRPEAASGAGARHRAEVQQRFRRVDRRPRPRRRLLSRCPSP